MSENSVDGNVDNKLRTSWVVIPENCDFTIHNIPFGVYRGFDGRSRCCTAIGGYVVDLAVLADNSYFNNIAGMPKNVFRRDTLNDFIALGKLCTNAVRERIIELLSNDNPELRERADLHAYVFIPMTAAAMLLPIHVGDYTDFYSSKEHASNIGSLLRDPENPLLPNWKHLPVAYHGRASSIVVSGSPVIRPTGQFKKSPADATPIFAATERLDFELELAFVIGKNSQLGEPIAVDESEQFIFGFMLFNDWSARDIQSWEYAPLGPFLSKNFMSSVSPWIVTTEALQPFKVAGPEPDVQLLPYLQHDGRQNYDIGLQVLLAPRGEESHLLSSTNSKHLYWNAAQQLAHHTVTGCNVRIGDLMASGTISGPGLRAQGCLMELTRNGQVPLVLANGVTRKFLEDGDTVTMRAAAQKGDIRVGFGEVTGTVTAAHTAGWMKH